MLVAAALTVSAAGPVPAPQTAKTGSSAPLVLTDQVGAIDAESRGLAWMDAMGNATLEQVIQGAAVRFKPMLGNTIFNIGESSSLWLRYQIQRPAGQRQNWLIEFPVPVLDLVTVYQQDARGQWHAQSAGDNLAVNQWPERGRYAFFRLDLPNDQVRDVYVRIQHLTPLSLPVAFTSMAVHDQRVQVEYMGLGMAFGALILLIVACLAQAWVYRDRTYAWYSAYASLMTLAVAAYTGVAAHLLWSNSGYWADLSQGVLALLAAGASLLFVRHLVGLSGRFRRLNRLMYWGGWAGIALAGVFALVGKPAGLFVVGGYLAFAAFANLLVAGLAWRRGDAVGLWVLAAFVPLAVAVILTVLRVFGWLPISFATQYAVVIGSALEVPLLLVALSIRSRERHGAAAREQALSSQDALTGLLAAHLFHDRLERVIARHESDKQHAAVVFIDLVNYQRIKSAYGVAVAEQSLVRSVIKLRRLVRDVDTLSRIGESRFGLIMEGVSARVVVTDRAARLIAAGLMPLKGLKPDVTLQFHIASTLFNEVVLPAPALVAALGDMLRGMSSRTRRPIRFLEPEQTHRMPLEGSSFQDDDADSLLPAPGQDQHPAQSNA